MKVKIDKMQILRNVVREREREREKGKQYLFYLTSHLQTFQLFY